MRRQGFTVVETLIGLVLAVVVLGGLTTFLCSGTRLFCRSQERLDPRETVHLALNQVGLRLMDAWSFEVADHADRIAFRSARGDAELAFLSERGRITLREDGATRTLISSGVQAFTVREVFPGMLRLEVTLERTGRIVHEVRVPAVGERNALLPIRQVFDLDASRPRA